MTLAEYLRDLAKQKNFDDAKTGKLVALVEGEGDVTLTRAELRELVQPIAELPFSRHSTFAQEMDKLSGVKGNYDKWYNGYTDPKTGQHVRGAKEIADAALQAKSDADDKVAKFEKAYGPIDDIEDLGDDKGRTKSGHIVDLKKVEELTDQKIKGWGSDMMRLMVDSNEVDQRHWDAFGKPLNKVPLLQKVAAKQAAGEHDYTLLDAFDEEYGPKIAEKQTAARTKELDDAKKQGAMEERTRLMKGARNGAVISETGGALWDHVNATEKAKDGHVEQQSSDERENLFNIDFQTELAKREAVNE